ncbi:MAG: ABC transporter permease subunit [Pseudomonadota bacterium]
MEWNGIFLDVGRAVRRSTNDFIEFLTITFGDQFDAFSSAILGPLVVLERLLLGRTEPEITLLIVFGGLISLFVYLISRNSLIALGVFAVEAALFFGSRFIQGAGDEAVRPFEWLWVQELQVMTLIMVLAYAASRRMALVVTIGVAMYLIGAFDLWDQAMQTIAIMLVSIIISVVIGVPVGVLISRSNMARAGVNPILDLMQTIPSFVYLIPAVMLLGLGKVPAIIATVIYAVPPLIRLTDLGIRQVDGEVVEAGRAFGATRFQILKDVQLPLAMPSIMQGVNQTTMMALAMVVIASMIGARGVGETVLIGLQRNDPGRGLLGGLAIVVLAIVFDRITQAYGTRMQSYRSAGH